MALTSPAPRSSAQPLVLAVKAGSSACRLRGVRPRKTRLPQPLPRLGTGSASPRASRCSCGRARGRPRCQAEMAQPRPARCHDHAPLFCLPFVRGFLCFARPHTPGCSRQLSLRCHGAASGFLFCCALPSPGFVFPSAPGANHRCLCLGWRKAARPGQCRRDTRHRALCQHILGQGGSPLPALSCVSP